MEVTVFYFIKETILKCDLYLQDGLYSEVAFNTGLSVSIYINSKMFLQSCKKILGTLFSMLLFQYFIQFYYSNNNSAMMTLYHSPVNNGSKWYK